MDSTTAKGKQSDENDHDTSVDSQMTLPDVLRSSSSQEQTSASSLSPLPINCFPPPSSVHHLSAVSAVLPTLPSAPSTPALPTNQLFSMVSSDSAPNNVLTCPSSSDSAVLLSPPALQRSAVPLVPLGTTPQPPPLPPLLLAPPAMPTTISTFVGTLNSLHESAQRQRKWAVIIIMPSGSKLPFPPLPANDSVRDNVLVWRRSSSSSEASRYTAFFPVDGFPHVALIDPRTGERLLVWGNEDELNMENHTLSLEFWTSVEADLDKFIASHSLEDDAVGPVHLAEKPWSVRTRRVKENDQVNRSAIPTSIMDDEEAAIAAAIAASLRDVDASRDVDMSDDEDHESDVNEDEDCDDNNTGNDQGDLFGDAGVDSTYETSNHEDDDGRSISSASQSIGTSAALSTSGHTESSSMISFPCSPPPSRQEKPTPPKCIMTPSAPSPSAGRNGLPLKHEALASSVESVSSSYLDRMASCLRSSNDPALLEARRLRQAQDDELQIALQRDRELQAAERAQLDAARSRMNKIRAAEARLKLLSEQSNGKADVNIDLLLRFGDGHRITKQLPNTVVFDVVRDVATIETKGDISIEGDVASTFRSPGIDLSNCSWSTRLTEAGLGSRAALFVLQ